MFRKIVATFLVCLIFIGVLAAGGLTIREFAHKIELKNPINVFQPLIQKLGIDFDFNIDSDSGGSVLVDAEGDHNDETENSDGNETTNPGGNVDSGNEDSGNNNGNESPGQDEENKPTKVTKDQVNRLIAFIRVLDEKNIRTGYDRSIFESPSHSYELNGKKYNRNDYAWMTSEYLISENPFKYKCPYTGLIIEDDSKLDYDHIIPLSVVYKNTDWDAKKCNEYAYNQDIGVDVYYSANRSKSDKTPSEWLPNTNIENYCYTWLVIAAEWNIPLSQRDIDICQLYCINAINSGQALERIN